MGRREERFVTKGTMNLPEVGEVDDGDVGCACHLRGSLRKSIYGTFLPVSSLAVVERNS